MICLRCGYCCKKYAVVIVDNPDKGICESNLICYMGDSQCKHLRGDKPGEYSCAVHDRPWYEETPCFEFGQIEKDPGFPCRVGVKVLEMEEQNVRTDT